MICIDNRWIDIATSSPVFHRNSALSSWAPSLTTKGCYQVNLSRHGGLSKKSKLEDTHKVNVLLDNGRKQFSSLTGKMGGIKKKWTILSSTVLIWFWPWILVAAGVRGETQTCVFLFLDLTFWVKKRQTHMGYLTVERSGLSLQNLGIWHFVIRRFDHCS